MYDRSTCNYEDAEKAFDLKLEHPRCVFQLLKNSGSKRARSEAPSPKHPTPGSNSQRPGTPRACPARLSHPPGKLQKKTPGVIFSLDGNRKLQ